MNISRYADENISLRRRWFLCGIIAAKFFTLLTVLTLGLPCSLPSSHAKKKKKKKNAPVLKGNFIPIYYSKIRMFSFTARKRFAVPSDEEPPRPVPVRLFPRRNEAVAAICDESSRAAPPQVAESTCDFCLRAPCITSSDFKPRGRCSARLTNHKKRRTDYKWYWKTLKDNGLWDNPTYLDRKQELGCLIDDVREVMPHCVIKDVRDRWPNPPNVPYQGHRRSWKASWPYMDRPQNSFSAQYLNEV